MDEIYGAKNDRKNKKKVTIHAGSKDKTEFEKKLKLLCTYEH